MSSSDTPEPAALTILSTPKAMRGHFAVIQRNAVTSWTRLSPRPEVILFGNDDGVAELCTDLAIQHVPDVRMTPEGTPLLSDMFLQGQALATTPVVCWSNADVIFNNRLMECAAFAEEPTRPAYIVGQRTDVDLSSALDFEPGWQEELTQWASDTGERKPQNWIDYFIFTNGLFAELPPFAIGRPGYDLWLIWRAADLGARVIDATDFLPAIHQRHDYSHVGARKDVFDGPEAKRNAAIVDDWRHYHSVAFATELVTASGTLEPARGLKYRIARPRSYLAHALRFLRPLRRRLLGERATRQRSARLAQDDDR